MSYFQAFRANYCFLGICLLLLASCHKQSVTPPPALSPPPANPTNSPTSSATRNERTQANPHPKATNKAGSTSPAIAQSKSQPEPSAVPIMPVSRSLDVKVRIKSAAGGRETIDLGTAIRNALDAFTPGDFIVECPVRMRVGSTEKVRLAIRRNLSDLFRQKLQEQGIPDEYLNGIIMLVVVDLASPSDRSFAIRPEPAAGHASDTWVWDVEALQPGNHKLELKVTLSARIPSRGELQTTPVLSRTITVDAEPFYPFGDFFDRYWLALTGSVAALMVAWLIWLVCHTRRTPLNHR